MPEHTEQSAVEALAEQIESDSTGHVAAREEYDESCGSCVAARREAVAAAEKVIAAGWLSPGQVAERERTAEARGAERAQGPYRCCDHCAEDPVHDLEPNQHAVRCTSCDRAEVRKAVDAALLDVEEQIEADAEPPSSNSNNFYAGINTALGHVREARARGGDSPALAVVRERVCGGEGRG